MTSAIHPMLTLDYSLMRPAPKGLADQEEITSVNKMSTGDQGGPAETPSASQLDKPPLPPKPSTIESTQLSDSKADSPISSSSRSCFHPEGSIDLSPSCSESLPTTPAYLKWAENMQFLLDDGDGCELFKEYLDQQSLGHLLEFVLAVKGFKITVGGQTQSDEDLKLRLIKTINKRYINSLGKNLSSKIECLTQDQRKGLDEKILSKTGLDLNVFDGLNASVLEHLESKCYPNFLTSEIYIQHVQSYADVNVQVSGDKYLSSTASSSICGPPGLSTSKQGADDSGISGITTSEKTGNPGLTGSVTSPPGAHAELSTASTSCNVSQLLPTVKEDSEMNFSSKGFGARPKTSTSLMSKSMSALTTESHPSIMSSASFPYHAHSSNWNPVSRQDSELQSQSSGAGGIFAGAGDTTDTDNYSTFRAEPPQQASVQQMKPRHHTRRTSSKTVKEVKNKENAQFIPRPFISSEPYSLATNNPEKFAKDLSQRLNQVLASRTSDSKLKGILDLNKTKSSTYADSYDLESDQSILDEHVDRVFNADERRHNVSSMMDTSRMSNYQATGYRTLDTSQRHHHSFYGPPTTSHSQYNRHLAGDLAYFPSSKASKSFSDTGFGMTSQPSSMMRHPYSFQQPQMSHGNDRVTDWLKTTNPHHMDHPGSNSGFSKTSPRSSGRHQQHQKRTRSQDRYGLQQQQFPSNYNASMLVNEASRRLTRQQQMNQSLPVAPSQATMTTEFTTAKYLFPSSKDNTPFLVKIPQLPPITLNDVKRHLPKKGFYRFYFKTEVDGEAVFQEEIDEHVAVPLWKGTVTVQCNDCSGLL